MASATSHNLAISNGILQPPGPAMAPAPKRQRVSQSGEMQPLGAFDENMSDDEDQGKKQGSKLSTQAKRFQHCEVEKRRRERMNRYMAELAQMIPACNAVPRRLDKLSILKMAVDHMKNLRGDPHAASDYKPGFLSDDELKHLLVEAANGFMVIISCSQARVLFVSDAVQDVLQESPENWTGACFYDLLHPKDIQKVKEQLACFDLEEALKASVRQNVSNSPLIMHTQSMNGLRRSFLCRVKRTRRALQASGSQAELVNRDYNRSEDVIRLLQSSQHGSAYDYAVLHCTGFIRNLTAGEQQSLRVEDTSSGACLVAVARLQQFGDGQPQVPMEVSENEFVTRVAADGRFTYVDPRIAGVLGYLPQDLVGQVSYEFYHPEDIQKMLQLHHDAMKRRTPMPTVQYRFLSKDQKWVWLAMKAFCFINPFSQQVEYVVCTNVLIRSQPAGDHPVSPVGSTATVATNPGADPGQAMDTDKQRSIERYVRMSISNQVEHQIMSHEQGRSSAPHVFGPEDDALSSLLPLMQDTPQGRGASYPNPHLVSSASGSMVSMGASSYTPTSAQAVSASSALVHSGSSASAMGPIVSTAATTTFEENAATVQRILEEMQRLNPQTVHRRDLHYGFPDGLFPSEVDLEGSQQAYQHLVHGLDNPNDFLKMFDQVEADPLRQQSLFGELNFDPFD